MVSNIVPSVHIMPIPPLGWGDIILFHFIYFRQYICGEQYCPFCAFTVMPIPPNPTSKRFIWESDPELDTRQFSSFATPTTRQRNRASGTRKNYKNI